MTDQTPKILKGNFLAAQQRTLDDIQSARWDIAAFEKSRLPWIFGAAANRASFMHPVTMTTHLAHNVSRLDNVVVQARMEDFDFIGASGLYVEDMPIKFPGTKYRIPAIIWDNYADVLKQCMAWEDEVNPYFDDCYIYLTIQQSHVSPGKTQRRPGAHVDGFQKAEIIPQYIQHQIAVSNAVPTVFYETEIPENLLQVSKHDFFRVMAEKCEDAPCYTPQEFDFHLLNAFCPHAPGLATKPEFRTFIRFSASVIPFMASYNTRNPLFDYKWDDAKKAAFYASIARP